MAQGAFAGRLGGERFHILKRGWVDGIEIVPIPQTRQRRERHPAFLKGAELRINVARRVVPEHGQNIPGQKLQNAGMIQDDVGVHHHSFALRFDEIIHFGVVIGEDAFKPFLLDGFGGAPFPYRVAFVKTAMEIVPVKRGCDLRDHFADEVEGLV